MKGRNNVERNSKVEYIAVKSKQMKEEENIMLMCESMWFILCTIFLYICFVPRPFAQVGHLAIISFSSFRILFNHIVSDFRYVRVLIFG